MKILYVTDLHGDVSKYDRLYQTALSLKVDMVINGGDMLPKNSDLHRQGDFISQYLIGHFKQFDDAKIHYLCLLGNDDLRIYDELLERVCADSSYVKNIAQKTVQIGDCEFTGMNWVVDYPFRLKDRCRKDTTDYKIKNQLGTALFSTRDGWKEIKDWQAHLDNLPTIEDELKKLERPSELSKSIYIIHAPPSGLGLDVCSNGFKAGSVAVHNFLKSNQPKLSLHGHIHESPEVSGKWKAVLGKTVCVQPGQMKGFTYAVIDLDDMHCERFVE
jgi:Icc-related predicted phosphoesterase